MLRTQTVCVPNRLLSSLPVEDYLRLFTECESVELQFADVLYHAGEVIRYVYFPTGSFISSLTTLERGIHLEVGLIGNEGMLGVTLVLENLTSPFHALVQGAGPALRIPVDEFLQRLEDCSALKGMLKRYLYMSMIQLARSGACNRFHVVEARLARWLLMTQDRAHSETFYITHVFLAYMLGVRRVGITKAANALQRRNLISYHRGYITVLDRSGLERVACGCYHAEKAIYEQILGG